MKFINEPTGMYLRRVGVYKPFPFPRLNKELRVVFNFQQCRDYCLMQLQSVEDFPFGPDAYVYKVAGKIFAILGEEQGIARVNLKCDPTEALMLRDIFAAISPGYHMNKQHWNTVLLDGSVPDNEVKRQIDNSYQLIVKSLPKAKRPVLAK